MAAASPPWVILDRVAGVRPDDEAHHTSVSLAAPRSLSTLTVPSSIYSDPSDHNKRPYVVAADKAGLLLLHLNRPPFNGNGLYPNPPGSLVVLRDFHRVHGTGEQNHYTGIAIRVPDPIQPAVPRISNVRHVGLITLRGRGGADYIVAELNFVSAGRARLLYFRSGIAAWVEREMTASGAPDAWVKKDFQDVMSHNGELWWVNFEWGFLSCDPFDDDPEAELLYTESPDREGYLLLPEDIRWNRIVRVSKRWIRYVEVTYSTVVMWTLVEAVGGLMRWWKQKYEKMLVPIWESDSYRETGMPEEVPSVAAVHPSKPKVLYFFLRDHFFGVNVEERVVEFITQPYYEQVEVVDGLPSPLSWRYVLAWVLPPSLSEGIDNPDEAPPAEGCGSAGKRRRLSMMNGSDKIAGE